MTIKVASVWRKLHDISGVSTEVLGIDATSGPPRFQVVIIPGNPGSAAYFRPFLAHLHRLLDGTVDILAVTHAGHDPDTDHGGRLWDLGQQIDHKLAFLREKVLLPGRPPVVLVGHSIGAAMMVKTVAQLEGRHTTTSTTVAAVTATGEVSVTAAECLPSICKLVAVFPFFETNFFGSARQRGLRAAAHCYEALGWVGATLSRVPLQLRTAVIRLGAAMGHDAAALTARLLTRHTVRNAFYLARHEFKELSQPWDWSLLSALGPRLHVLGCTGDPWLSRQQLDVMVGQVPGLQATWHDDLTHAFCVCERQSATVAAIIADIATAIDHTQPTQPGAVGPHRNLEPSHAITPAAATTPAAAAAETEYSGDPTGPYHVAAAAAAASATGGQQQLSEAVLAAAAGGSIALMWQETPTTQGQLHGVDSRQTVPSSSVTSKSSGEDEDEDDGECGEGEEGGSGGEVTNRPR